MMNKQNSTLASLLLLTLVISMGCAGFGRSHAGDVEFQPPEELGETGPMKIEPLSFDEEMNLADRLRDSGQHPEAAWHYIRGMQLDQESPIPRQRLGYMQLSRDVDRAEKIFLELAAEHPELSSAYVGLGLAQIANGRHALARASLEQALQLDEDSAVAHMGLGMLYDRSGAYDLATSHYQKAHDRNPKRYEIKNNLGMSLLRSGDYEAAAEAFRDAIYLEPRDPVLYNNLGITLGHLGDYRGAFESFRKFSNEADALNDLGYVCLMNGDSDKAIAYFERSLLAGPSNRTTVLVNMRAAENASVPH